MANCNTMMDYIEYDETIIFMNTENHIQIKL